MVLKYLLLVLTLAVWLCALAFTWPRRLFLSTESFEFFGQFATWTALAQVIALLAPLANRRSVWLAVLLLTLGSARLGVYWLSEGQDFIEAGLIQLAGYQLVALVPVTIAMRCLGWRLDRQVATEADVAARARQFSLRSLLLWTAVAALYCLLVRSLDRELAGEWITVVFFIALPACLALLSAWAALGARGVVWRPAVPIFIVVVAANVLGAVDYETEFSTWQAAIMFGAPTVLVWLTCLTLRAFGWRVIRQRVQPASSEPLAAPSEIA